MSSGPGPESGEPAKKRRRRGKAKESIYIKPDPTPYTPAIKPLKATRLTAQTQNDAREGDENQAESSRLAVECAESREKNYRARALKAWETKRRRQAERFEALESSTWPGECETSEVWTGR